MERSSTIFAISSHFYDNPHNRGRYHRAAGTPLAPPPPPPHGGGNARRRPAPAPAPAPTYTWIVEQELAALSKEISETRQWAFEQQAYFGLLPKDKDKNQNAGAARQQRGQRPATEKRPRPRDVGPAGRDDDVDVDRDRDAGAEEEDESLKAWLRARLRAAAALRAERDQLQEEFDKMEARWRVRIDREGRRRRQEQQWEWAEREREQRARAEKQREVERRSAEEAWGAYERRWAAIAGTGVASSGVDGGLGGQSQSQRPLRFKSVPWPTIVPPRNVADITPAAISKFIFSSAHSEGMSRKERIKNALRRWHPDRFGRVLSRVDEKDKGAVERGVGVVARCLNELLAQEK